MQDIRKKNNLHNMKLHSVPKKLFASSYGSYNLATIYQVQEGPETLYKFS